MLKRDLASQETFSLRMLVHVRASAWKSEVKQDVSYECVCVFVCQWMYELNSDLHRMWPTIHYIYRRHCLKCWVLLCSLTHSWKSARLSFENRACENTLCMCVMGDYICKSVKRRRWGKGDYERQDLGWRGGSIGRASVSRFNDPRFEPRQEQNKNLSVFPSQQCCAVPLG